jgi:hypothetical protein
MSYSDTVLSVRPNNQLGYWPGNELSGSVAYDLSPAGHNGTYHGVTLNQPGFDGQTSVFYPGTACYTDIYSASRFNGRELSIQVCFKVDLATWSDGVSRRWFTTQPATSNRILFQKNTTTGLSISYIAGGVNRTISKTDIVTETGWVCLLLTVSKTADQMKLYINGTLYDTKTNLGTWVGVPDPTNTVIGAGSASPSQITHGWISNVAIWDYPLSADDALTLAEPARADPSLSEYQFIAQPRSFEFIATPRTFEYIANDH